jgi:L-ascorbate metabolism protein UlaG (beta-lactamase superfamily)
VASPEVASPERRPHNAQVTPTDGRVPPDARTRAPSSTGASSQPSERVKELEFEQRARLRGAPGAVLSLAFLRRAAMRFFGRTLPAAARPVPHPAEGTLALTFGGHATVMITAPRLRIVVDPVLEPSLHGLPRARQAALAEGDLDDVTLVLVSNALRDHLSRPTLARLPGKATLVVPGGCEGLVGDLGFMRVVELAPGEAHAQAGARVTAVPARHTARRSIFDRRSRGAIGYVLEVDGQSLYLAGDTGYFSGFAEIGRQFGPDVAVLPIGGYQPAPLRREHLSPLDALYAFEELRARVLIPVHYGSFQLSYEPLDEPLAWLREAARRRGVADALVVLEHGQTCLLRK